MQPQNSHLIRRCTRIARCRITDDELKKLAELYNSEGKRAVYEVIKTKFNIKNPYQVVNRMRNKPSLYYNEEKDFFDIGNTVQPESIFMTMEELCSPIVPHHITMKEQEEIDSRPAAMDKLIRELIGDRLLELNKYVTIDSLSKRIIIDKTTLIQDGYQLVTH